MLAADEGVDDRNVAEAAAADGAGKMDNFGKSNVRTVDYVQLDAHCLAPLPRPNVRLGSRVLLTELRCSIGEIHEPTILRKSRIINRDFPIPKKIFFTGSPPLN